MAMTKEFGNTAKRCKSYIDRLIDLFRRYKIKSVKSLIANVRTNKEFRRYWQNIWQDVARAEGGKISLTTAGAILGSSLGGVGIAAMGGAIGLPLALILGLGGFIAGTEFDSLRWQAKNRYRLLRIPAPLFARVKAAADSSGMAANELIVQTLSLNFPDQQVLEAQVIDNEPHGK